MAGEIEVEVVVDGEVEGRYRLPLSKTPRQLLPYLLRDIGLPVVVGARRCFYKVDYRAKSRLRGDSEWLTLSPDRRLADASLPRSVQLSVVDLGTTPFERLGNMEASHPEASDKTSYVAKGRSQMPATEPPEPPEAPVDRSLQRQAAARAPALPEEEAHDDAVRGGVRTVRVKVSHPERMMLPRSEDAYLAWTGSKWAEVLAASFDLAEPPIHDLWHRSHPAATWAQLGPGEVLQSIGVSDDWEFRIGPDVSSEPNPEPATAPPPPAAPVVQRLPEASTDLPPVPRRGTPWYWKLVVGLSIVAFTLLVLLLARGKPGGGGGPADQHVGGAVEPVVQPTQPAGTLGPVPAPPDPFEPATCKIDGRRQPCSVKLAFDARPDTAWCFSPAHVGKEVRIPLPDSVVALAGVGIYNGYIKTEEGAGTNRFLDNHRVRSVEINGTLRVLDTGWPDGARRQDTKFAQPLYERELRLRVVDYTEGRLGSADICVSGIEIAAWSR